MRHTSWSDADVLAYLMGESSPDAPLLGAADLEDLRVLLADGALWADPSPALVDRTIAAIAVEASTAPALPPGTTDELAEVIPLPVWRRRIGRTAAAAAVVAASVAASTFVVDHNRGPAGTGPIVSAADSGAAYAPQAQAVRLPTAGAPSVPLTPREKEGMSQADLDELFGDSDSARGPDLGRFPGLIYWLATGPDGSARLSREVAALYDRAGRANGALRAMLIRKPSDPDERNPWPTGSNADVDLASVHGGSGAAWPAGTAVVYLNAAALRGNASVDVARMAVQQIVWTLTANDPTIRQVVISTDDADARRTLHASGLWGSGVSVREPVRPGDPLRVLAPVQLDGPAEGSSLNTGLFAVSGAAVSPDGRLRWQVLSRGQMVREGTASTGAPGSLSPFVFRLSLPPGTYTLTVHVGADGNTAGVSRTIRVKGTAA